LHEDIVAAAWHIPVADEYDPPAGQDAPAVSSHLFVVLLYTEGASQDGAIWQLPALSLYVP